jgi:hypothetical protein
MLLFLYSCTLCFFASCTTASAPSVRPRFATPTPPSPPRSPPWAPPAPASWPCCRPAPTRAARAPKCSSTAARRAGTCSRAPATRSGASHASGSKRPLKQRQHQQLRHQQRRSAGVGLHVRPLSIARSTCPLLWGVCLWPLGTGFRFGTRTRRRRWPSTSGPAAQLASSRRRHDAPLTESSARAAAATGFIPVCCSPDNSQPFLQRRRCVPKPRSCSTNAAPSAPPRRTTPSRTLALTCSRRRPRRLLRGGPCRSPSGADRRARAAIPATAWSAAKGGAATAATTARAAAAAARGASPK